MNQNLTEIFTRNGRRYAFRCVVYPVTGDINSTQRESEETDSSATPLPIASIENIVISNSLVSPVLNGHIIFKDEGGLLCNYIGTCDSFCDITFGAVDLEGNPTEEPFIHRFIIDGIEILESTLDKTRVKINLISIHSYTFNSRVSYISSAAKSGTEHISSLISISGLWTDVVVTDYENNSPPFKFLLPANWSLNDGIYYILNRMILIGEGLYFIVYDPKSNKYLQWRWSDTLLAKELGEYNIAYIPSKNRAVNAAGWEMLNIQYNNYVTNTQAMEVTKDQRNTIFNYNDGWKPTYFKSGTNIISSNIEELQSGSGFSRGFKSKFTPFPENIGGNQNTIYNENEWTGSVRGSSMWKKIKNSICANGVLSFTLEDGIINRIPGTDFTVTGELKSFEAFGLPYGFIGKWKTLQVDHIITPDSYSNKIYLGRTTAVENVFEIMEK